MNLRESYEGKRVFITGHTGFKGAWLTEWLLHLGARVTGYSLAPPTNPALFSQLGLEKQIAHLEGDIRQIENLSAAIKTAQPDFVFHLAAQSLVRLSYEQPRETWEVNVMGTVNTLEALRQLRQSCAAVMITTDKCYENREWIYGYREDDSLGGFDPYSSSKAGAEIAISAYRRSFFGKKDSPVAVASARAGNVIGGGDWAADRILPDCIRALQAGQPIPVRNRSATRPWQHVLEPLGGYLELGARLKQALDTRPSGEDRGRVTELASAFNFGPRLESNRTVGDVVDHVLQAWPGSSRDQPDEKAPHEAQRLNLSIDKAFHLLAWAPRWNFSQTIEKTVEWYRRAFELRDHKSDELSEFTRSQIRAYEMARSEERD